MIFQERIDLSRLTFLSDKGCPAFDGVEITGPELLERLQSYTSNRHQSEGWPVWKSRPINHYLSPLLASQTLDHCSFCDGYPLHGGMTPCTVEHFRPKSGSLAHEELRFEWVNLFACCSDCQRCKGSKWHEDLLKPDDIDYKFEKYFDCDFETGRILPSERAAEGDKLRAAKTIEIYNLNRGAHIRLRYYEKHPIFSPDLPLDEKSYRYWISALEEAAQQKHRKPSEILSS